MKCPQCEFYNRDSEMIIKEHEFRNGTEYKCQECGKSIPYQIISESRKFYEIGKNEFLIELYHSKKRKISDKEIKNAIRRYNSSRVQASREKNKIKRKSFWLPQELIESFNECCKENEEKQVDVIGKMMKTYIRDTKKDIYLFI